MECQGSFIFKSIEKKDGGEFTNDKGQLIKYDSTYRITVDDNSGNKIVQRFFKFSSKNSALYEKFKSLEPYSRIIIAFNIELYQSSVKLIPYDVICE